MITTISKQGGRRYPQMQGSTLAAQFLPSVGTTAAPVAVPNVGSRYRWGYRGDWIYLFLIGVWRWLQ